MELAKAPVDEDEVGEGLLFLLEVPVSAFDCFPHARKIVIPPFSPDNEFAVIGFFHPSVFPHDH